MRSTSSVWTSCMTSFSQSLSSWVISWSRGDSQVGTPDVPARDSVESRLSSLERVQAKKTGFIQFEHLLFRYSVPSMEEGGRWEPDQRNHVHHLSVQPPGSQNSHSHWDTGRVMSSRNMFNYLSSAVLYETLKLHFVDFIRLYTKPVRRVSVTSLMLRSSHTTSPIMTTSTLSTATCSRGWPRTSVGYGES